MFSGRVKLPPCEARAGGAQLVTTEKDFVRLSPADCAGIAVLNVAASHSTTTSRLCWTGCLA